MSADEVQHGACRLAGRLAEAAAKLLQEECRTLRRSEHQNRVDCRHVDALVEQVNGEHNPDSSVGEILERRLAVGARTVAPHGNRGNTVLVEVVGHEACVFDADAEAKGTKRSDLAMLGNLMHDQPRPRVGAGVQVAQRVDVIAAVASPRDLPQVEPIMNPEVQKRREVLLVDRFPESKFGSDAVVEPVQDWQPIAALRCRCESEELDRGDVIEDVLIQRCCGVMELVDDHHIEMVGRQRGEIAGVQTLDRREHVVESCWSRSTHPLLTERCVAQRVAECGETLIEDLLTVCDEQQPGSIQPAAQRGIVECGHDGLAGARCGDEQVAVMVSLP